MLKKILSLICALAIIIPGTMVYAQDEVVPEKTLEETDETDAVPVPDNIKESKIDSVDVPEVIAESLLVVPSVEQSEAVDLKEFQTDPELVPYGFRGTGKDIIIGAVVLGGWFLVAYLAANQKEK